MKLNKKWKIFLINHSHTDIGYTERQDKIINYHCDFIRQAIDILNNSEEDTGFVWQCENYWQVKNFYAHAEESYIRDFEKYVKEGKIGLSGNYLNMTELISYDILNSRTRQAKEYGERIGYPIKSGMTADVNGFAWGYADALKENGVEHLYSCLHPHHGMFPLYKKQIPFYWESPKGEQVLVWNGEHYHFGNELHFVPHGGSTYMIHDDIADQAGKEILCKQDAAATEEEEFGILCTRLERYLNNLDEEGYGHDFVPFMVSGAITDNAPPNVEIAKRAEKLSRMYPDMLEVKMATLDEFFAHVKENWQDIPVYKGDWNDWWADGVGSTPAVVKNFRDAQRKYNLCKKLDPEGTLGCEADVESAAENLMLYAEHTWGYSSSVSEPWETMVGDLELKKSAYAINGNTDISRNLDKVLEKKGEVSIRAERPQQFKIINPHSVRRKSTALLFVEFWEYMEGVDYGLDVPIEVVNVKTQEVLPSQVKRIPRAYQIEVLTDMEAGEEIVVEARRSHVQNTSTVKNHAHIGAESIADVLQPDGYQESIYCVETDFYKVSFDEDKGITSILDKKDGSEIIRSDETYPAFSGIYEVTDIRTTALEERRRMGRNRKSVSTRRYSSQLENITIEENGAVFVSVKMDYQLEGTGFYSVFLKIYKGIARIDAMVRVHKTSVWEPENLYISLPFTAGEKETKYVDKTGCVIRPGLDQLPGSNKEFYLIQSGMVLEGKEKDLVIAVKDTPLLTFGTLKAKPIELCSADEHDFNRQTSFAWAMNNYWETNFKVDLGGFYEFAYSITSMEKTSIEEAMQHCEAANEGLPAFYI